MFRRYASVLVLVGLALVAGSPVHAALTPTSAVIQWSAPGDDSLSGTASVYDVRLSTSAITAGNFAAASQVGGAPAPLLAGTSQSMVISGLVPSTSYWVAIKTADERGNWSLISNVITFFTPAQTDSIRPAATAVSVTSTTTTSVTLSWVATGDDSLAGTADHYDVRWSTSPINPGNWNSATRVTTGVPSPAAPGTVQGATVGSLDRSSDLYFAVRVYDEVNNPSAIASAPVVPHLLDSSPPSAPTGMSAAWQVGGVRVNWTANAEADLAGYRVYRAITSGGTFTLVNGSLVVATNYLDVAAPDSASLWYQLSAVDQSGNESSRSAIYRLWRDGAPATSVQLLSVYPNPSSLTTPVTIPIAIPPSGATDGRLDILDGAGQRLRTIALHGLATGTASVSWDGRNDSGRLTSPGVYRALLHLGGTTQVVQFVRRP